MIQLPAVYERGVFRPLVPLNLPENARVMVEVFPHQQGKFEVLPDAEFNQQLNELCTDGPVLPTDFSRNDIYSDHD